MVMRILAASILTIVCASTAWAYDAVKHLTLPVQLKLSNVLLSSNPEFSTITNANTGFGLIVVEIDYTRVGGSAVTALNMQCFGNIYTPGNAFDDIMQTCVTSNGVCNSFDSLWTKSVSTSKNWIWRIDAQGYDNVRCVFSTTGAAGTDTISVNTKITSF